MNYIKSVFAILLAGTLLFGCGEKNSDNSDVSGCISAITADTSESLWRSPVSDCSAADIQLQVRSAELKGCKIRTS